MLVSQAVLIQISAKAQGDKPEKVIWRSRLANCSSSCRPLRLCFQCESKRTVLTEYDRIKGQIRRMEVYAPEDTEEGVEDPLGVDFEFYGIPSLFDQSAIAKILGVGADSSCPFCKRTVNQLCFRNGHFPLHNHEDNCKTFSNLHFGPRSMELCTNIGEKIDFKRFIAKGDNVQIREDRNKSIKNQVRRKCGFRINMCAGKRQGSTNTGNAARRFYKWAAKIAKILKIPVEFLNGLKTVWDILRCPYMVDSTKAQAKCDQVLDQFFEFFKMTEEEKQERIRNGSKAEMIEVWFKIASAVHKILVHMKQLLDRCPVPPGLVSEEAPECNNGRIRFIFLRLTRKISRLKMMTDLVNRLLLISDPHMLEFVEEKAMKKRKKTPLSQEVRDMLLNPEEEDFNMPFFDDLEIIEADREIFDGEVLQDVVIQEDDNDAQPEIVVNDDQPENVVIDDPQVVANAGREYGSDDPDAWSTEEEETDDEVSGLVIRDKDGAIVDNQVPSGSGIQRPPISINQVKSVQNFISDSDSDEPETPTFLAAARRIAQEELKVLENMPKTRETNMAETDDEQETVTPESGARRSVRAVRKRPVRYLEESSDDSDDRVPSFFEHSQGLSSQGKGKSKKKKK